MKVNKISVSGGQEVVVCHLSLLLPEVVYQIQLH
jgi:hypothetical protein